MRGILRSKQKHVKAIQHEPPRSSKAFRCDRPENPRSWTTLSRQKRRCRSALERYALRQERFDNATLFIDDTMSKLRGDDALFSVLDEMSTKQGYDIATANASNTSHQATKQSAGNNGVPQQRLIPEIQAYPSLTRQAGNDTIWNPYISSPASPCNTSASLFAPTNPWVEVFRRRAFEKFKSKFQATWEGMVTMMDAKSHKNVWKQVSIQTVLERWHFAIKLDEYTRVKQQRQEQEHKGSTRASDLPTIRASTSDIQSRLLQGHDKGTLMDPILVASTSNGNNSKSRRRHRNDGNKSNDNDSETTMLTNNNNALHLLSAEIQMEWTRAWQKQVGGKSKNDELEVILQSHKFRRVVSKLNRAVQDLALEVESSFWSDLAKRSQTEELQSSSSLKRKGGIPKIRFNTGEDGSMVSVTHCGLTFSLHHRHYEKLQILFDRSNINTHYNIKDAFACALFCVLCRYDMLEGAGLQSSLHGSVFDVLLQHFKCRMECFASPFNCRYEHYCSAYPDTDTVFGSVGSFFDYNFAETGGSFQANPPFVADFILRMHDTISQALEKATEPLQFIVFVPAWTETEGYKALESSSHLTLHVLLKQKSSHYYCEGTQHRRKERYRVASFDTSVFFLQNKAALEKWPVTSEALNDLRTAFETNPNDEVKDTATKVDKSNTKKPVATPIKSAGINESKLHEATVIASRSSREKHQRQVKKAQKKVASKTSGKKKKRKTVDNQQEQLSILSSLGILDTKSESKSDNKPASGKGHHKKKSKKMRKKHKDSG